MLNESGKNLSVVVVTETGRDWEAFSTWYSVYKNLPEANVVILCLRNKLTPFQYFQWSKRLNVPTIFTNVFDEKNEIASIVNGLAKCEHHLKNETLVLKPLTVVTEPLPRRLLKVFTKNIFDPNFWFLKEPNFQTMLDDIYLGSTIQESDVISVCAKDSGLPECIVNCNKGVGRWIHTSRGCPFSNVSGLATHEMTANEKRIIELWRTMCSLYQATN